MQLRTLDYFVACGGEPIDLTMQGRVLGTMRCELLRGLVFWESCELIWIHGGFLSGIGGLLAFIFIFILPLILTIKEMLFKGGPRCCIVLQFASAGG